MTETLTPTRTQPGVTIRPYRPSDHNDCRRLWAELTRHRHGLYGEAGRESDAGAGFEEYLTQLNLSGMWVAEGGRGVVGFIGLMLDGRAGEVDPVVVADGLRGRGIGHALLDKVVDEARRRGLRRLTVSPSVRDLAALRSLHNAGFATVASVTLAYNLGTSPVAPAGQDATLDLHHLRFDT